MVVRHGVNSQRRTPTLGYFVNLVLQMLFQRVLGIGISAAVTTVELRNMIRGFLMLSKQLQRVEVQIARYAEAVLGSTLVSLEFMLELEFETTEATAANMWDFHMDLVVFRGREESIAQLAEAMGFVSLMIAKSGIAIVTTTSARWAGERG